MKVWWIFSFLSSVCFIKKAVLKLVCVPETQEKDVGKKADFFSGILFTSTLMCEVKMNESGSRSLIYCFNMLPHGKELNGEFKCLNCMC